VNGRKTWFAQQIFFRVSKKWRRAKLLDLENKDQEEDGKGSKSKLMDFKLKKGLVPQSLSNKDQTHSSSEKLKSNQSLSKDQP